MAVRYELVGVPDNLPPGQYATRVKNSDWINGDIVITLEFNGELQPNQVCLFTITKHEDSTLNN